MKKERNQTSWKNFLLTLAATTFSIILTFGTTAIIDRSKQNAAKREMVMMIMYDLHESLNELGKIDQDLKTFFEVQTDIIAHPDRFADNFVQLAVNIPVLEYTNTMESIFRSNIETMQTIGNILFIQSVSSFYDKREHYKQLVVNDFQNAASQAVNQYETLRDIDSPFFIFYSESFLQAMRIDFEQCKLMMNVSDQDLDRFSLQQQKQFEATREKEADGTVNLPTSLRQRRAKLQEAGEKGRKELK